MIRRLADIGFQVTNGYSYMSLAHRVTEEGKSIQTPAGTYFYWSRPNGVELWMKAAPEEERTYIHPHFLGKAVMLAAIVDRKSYENNVLAEGCLVAYPRPVKGQGFLSEHFCLQYGDGTYSNYIPFLFDAPDYDRYLELEMPFVADIQITAFPFYLLAFETEDDWIDWQLYGGPPKAEEEEKEEEEDQDVWGPETFCPSTMLHQRKDKDDYPKPTALIAGRVLETGIIENEEGGHEFCWAQVMTTMGDVDVVAAPDMINGYIVKGGILSCQAALSGRILTIPELNLSME
ncbi:MAG: hypothetical protein ICV60_03435 [Pyrinomonadaceae bacterium]|nr:hypothetical protein [Pyrinomonadaceae bacterium]